MRFFYHYATSRPHEGGGECLTCGTLDCAHVIDSTESYQDALRGMADHLGVEVGQFVVTSLTLLNPKETP